VQFAIRSFRRRVVPQVAIDTLADFRSEGIRILNEIPNGPSAVADWEKKWKEWSDQVTAYLQANFTKAESLSFRRLGLVPENRFSFAVTPEHAHYLMQLAKQITILENLIQQHQERH
jgi:hypothetical protein